MKTAHIYALTILFFFPWTRLCSQTGSDIPQIDTLSVVDTGSGNERPFMVWNRIAGVDGYIIFHYEWSGPNQIWYGTDTTYSESDTTYLHLSGNPGSQAEKYRIGVLDRSENGNFSGAFGVVHSSIYLSAVFNPCTAEIELSWTKYTGWTENIDEYRVFSGTEGASLQQIQTSGENDTTLVISGIEANLEYCFRIIAVSENGRTSSSNTVCVISEMPVPPAYINADYASLNEEGSINLSFHADPSGEPAGFILLRTQEENTEPDTLQTFQPESSGIYTYTDEEADPEEIWIYRLAALNDCGNTVCLSNPATNLCLSLLSNEASVNILQWNHYSSWLGGVDSYTIYRSAGGAAFEEIGTNGAGDSLWTDDISAFSTEGITGSFCYRIKALESDENPYGIRGSSLSNTVCIQLKTEIYFPSAIVPNSQISANRTFKPVFSYYPREYYLVVYNRWNNKVFETSNPEEGWDGVPGKGTSPAEAVYMFYCRLVSADGSVVEKNGRIAVLFNP